MSEETKYEKLFDPKFIHFMWSDELEGKECFVSDYITTIKSDVIHNALRVKIKEGFDYLPFEEDGACYHFAYYDPNYDIKRAYLDGKQIQLFEGDYWVDVDDPMWQPDTVYRVKPDAHAEPKEDWCCVFRGLADSLLIVNEGTAEYKTHEHLFEGTNEECQQWILESNKRMTYRQLAEWLAKGYGQCKTFTVAGTHVSYDNISYKDDLELQGEYKIRRWGSDKWIKPTLRVYLEDCKRQIVAWAEIPQFKE